jgi:hypothetical protein
LDEEARRRKTSKNRLIKELLSRELGLSVEGSADSEYTEFCGLWSAEEHREFAETQRENSRVDPGDWA